MRSLAIGLHIDLHKPHCTHDVTAADKLVLDVTQMRPTERCCLIVKLPFI